MTRKPKRDVCPECEGRGYQVEGSARDLWYQKYLCQTCRGEGFLRRDDDYWKQRIADAIAGGGDW